MDFAARAAWIYENATPDLAKIHRHEIKVIYIDPRSLNAAAVISLMRYAGVVVGAYFADSWHEEMTSTEWAAWASKLLNQVLPRVGTSEAPPCMLDLETHDIARASNIISAYKSHQPARPTSYSNGAFQAPNAPWSMLHKYNMPYYVQLYNGDMSPADAARASIEVCRYHSSAKLVFPFYDGARWGTDQVEGCYFTLERMP